MRFLRALNPSLLAACVAASITLQAVPAAARSYDVRPAATESVQVLGQRLSFSNPTGYCTPGRSPRELELVSMARRSLPEVVRLVHVAVRCSELDEFRRGERDLLDHWLQIQLISVHGKFQRLEAPREAFLSALAKTAPRLDPAQINRRLKDSSVDLSSVRLNPIGRDGNAVYFSLQAIMKVGEVARETSGISGLTLLNALPLAINVYEATGSPRSRNQLHVVQQDLLNSLLIGN
jgi:hypothetical protein